MFDWLFEGRTSVYVLLAAVAVGLFYGGMQLRRRRLLVAGGVVAALLGLYFLLDRFVETDREQVRRKLQEMAAAVQTHDPDQVLVHVSPKFSSQGRDRAAFRRYVEPRLRGGMVEELVLWDIAFPDGGVPAANGTLRVTFGARPKGGGLGTTAPVNVEATFGRDPDGEWRMLGFQVFSPIGDSREPLVLP